MRAGSYLASSLHCWNSVLSLCGPRPSHDFALILLASASGLTAFLIIFACFFGGGFCLSYIVLINVPHFDMNNSYASMWVFCITHSMASSCSIGSAYRTLPASRRLLAYLPSCLSSASTIMSLGGPPDVWSSGSSMSSDILFQTCGATQSLSVGTYHGCACLYRSTR